MVEYAVKPHVHFFSAMFEESIAYLPESLVIKTLSVLGRSPEIPLEEDPYQIRKISGSPKWSLLVYYQMILDKALNWFKL